MLQIQILSGVLKVFAQRGRPRSTRVMARPCGGIVTDVYGFDDLTPDVLAPAQEKLIELRTPGGPLQFAARGRQSSIIFRPMILPGPVTPMKSGPDFFLYDLSWAGFCSGQIDQEAIAEDTGITVVDLDSLQKAMEAIFEKHAPCAIAV